MTELQPPPSNQLQQRQQRGHSHGLPARTRPFDSWNSSSTGHQRAETRGPPGWRESRTLKLQSQFRAGHSGGERIVDRVGAGSDDFDESRGVLVRKDVRARAMNSVADILRNPDTMRSQPPPGPGRGGRDERSCSPATATDRMGKKEDDGAVNEPQDRLPSAERDCPPLFMEVAEAEPRRSDVSSSTTQVQQQQHQEQTAGAGRHIFDGLVIYVNGSTYPLISDHKLKRLLAEHGARTAIHLGRRQVTHVILGRPAGPNIGAGGGLAGGKLEKEIRRVGGCGIKYVGVEWVLESVKAGKRLPEARFANLKIAAKGQQSVLGAFSKK
ncbi:hypothetical protein B0H66DRAFT_116282 [Apodospora peruviana]|uniref:BRCT domain-containing protein n=1 Tax=Apodospora peruviana TaxID=516989 RepID=A0AAE0IHY3_9PEZI|nr:hypothetical protein B0H66DRAFT_116282 [Apodospora peruviana]